MAYKMKGHELPGPNQRRSPIKQHQLFDVTGDGVTSADVETSRESAVRGHSPRGNVVDILRKRKGDPKPPSAEEQEKMTEYSTKHGHRRPTDWEEIKSDFTGKSIKEIVTKSNKKKKK